LGAQEAQPLGATAGHLVALRRIDPVRAYERTVLLAPDGNYVASRVLDADGFPVAGAHVALYKFVSGGHGSRSIRDIDATTTDSEGRFEVGRSEGDWFGAEWTREWRLSVRAEGRPRWHGFPVAAGAPADVLLPHGRRVELTLRLDNGEPLAGARLRTDLIHLENIEGKDVEPYWSWGTTDADGRLSVVLAADHLDPLVAIEHPEHKSTLRLPESPPDGRLSLVLQRGRAVEVTWVGDLQAYEARGLKLPFIRLSHVNAPGRMRHWTPPAFRYTARREGALATFEHLSDEPIVLREGSSGPVLIEPFVPQVGRAQLEARLPALEPFEAGSSRWGATLQLVSVGPELAWKPSYVLTGADGQVSNVRASAADSDEPRPFWTTLEPPVTAHFPEWGLAGPQVSGIMPGDNARLLVDGARKLEWSAAIRVDTQLLDAERAQGLTLRVTPAGDSRPWKTHPTLIDGLPPGRWSYRVSGPGVEQLKHEVELAVGDELVLQPLPAPWPPPVDERPHDLRESHAIVEGQIDIRGDPWTFATRLLLRRIGSDAPAPPEDSEQPSWADPNRETLSVRGAAFRAAVPPGSYRAEITLARARYPSASLDQGFSLEDDHRLDDSQALLDPPIEFTVLAGERHRLDLSVVTEPARGMIHARLSVDGEPAPSSFGNVGAYQDYDVRWTDEHGQVRFERSLSLRRDYLTISVPPGPGTLRIVPDADRGAFVDRLPEPALIELIAPPPYALDGQPQALEVEVELHHVDAEDPR